MILKMWMMKKIFFALFFIFLFANLSYSQFRESGKGNKDKFDNWIDNNQNLQNVELNKMQLLNGTQSAEDKPSQTFNIITIGKDRLRESNQENEIISVQYQERELPMALYIRKESDNSDKELPVSTKVYNLLSKEEVKNEMKIVNEKNFIIQSVEVDELGITHVKMDQIFKSRLIFGGQIYVHFNDKQAYSLINGKWFKDPEFSLDIRSQQSIDENNKYAFTYDKSLIFDQIRDDLNRSGMNIKEMRGLKTGLSNKDQFKLEEMYFPDEKTGELKPVYVSKIQNDMLHSYKYIFDAQSGEILRKQAEHCSLLPEDHMMNPEGGVKATGKDLNNISREFNAYEKNGTYYMIDVARAMFNSGASTLPNDPSGVIWTLNAQNTYPNNSDFENALSHVSSGNLNNWNASAVSAHYNAGFAYEYYLNKFGRNSIDGKGGNVMSIINVSDEDGSGMDNAFWGGTAMFYGNGNKVFTAPLAKALDVAGHEMTHGVIQNSANLEYYGEPGAINESFADVFGVLMDREDWKLGEDIVSLQYFSTGALRDMSNPHNGGSNSNGYQPAHYTEKYTGTDDNGGVHINSGIPNFAFYKFASKVGKDKAEKVYYKALTNYLTKSSDFKDLRVAVESAASALYDNDTKNAVSEAFEAVGIGSSGGSGSTDLQDLQLNPGSDYVLCTDEDFSAIYLLDGSGNILKNPLTQTDIQSKPSVTDDGRHIIFVGTDEKIHYIYYNWAQGTFTESIIESNPIWRNAVISKDGSKLAALKSTLENKIHIYSFDLEKWQSFELKNPSTAQGIDLSNILFADALEFSYSGEYLMYDCKNSFGTGGFFDVSYWDIGFLNIWNNSTKNFAAGRNEKLFSGLEENESVGNPVFSKNSPYIIAFDYSDGTDYYIYGANVEKGELGQIFQNDDWSVPNFSRDDKKVIFDYYDNVGANIAIVNVDATKINQIVNSEKYFVEGGKWGVWFSNGTRKLTTDTKDIISEQLQETNFFPNPAYDYIHILSSLFKSDVKAMLFDIVGKKVLETELNFEKGQSELRLEGIKNGTYLLRLEDGKNVFTGKIIVLER
jgi:bacillolysin